MTQAPPEPISLFCFGCNARFRRWETVRFCPRCNAQLADADSWAHQPTMLFRDTDHELIRPEEDEFELEHLIGGQLHLYHCQELLGRGGMGYVFLARHLDLHRQCALKIISPKLVQEDAQFVEFFWNEGRNSAALVHPNIVTTHAIGDSEGHFFLEMEYVPGQSLQRALQRQRFDPLRATSMIAGIAEGLAAAHRAGLIHRDLKPDNVLLTHSGQPKISDFGLAKRIGKDSASGGQLAGTPHFMAPELLQGARASEVTDVYALGVCFFLLLTGRLPYSGRNLRELSAAHRDTPLPSVRSINPDVPLEIAECVGQMLDPAPDNRPGDGMAAALLLGAMLGPTRDTPSLLHEAVDREPRIGWINDAPPRYELQVTLEDQRKQRVFIEDSGHAAPQRLLLIMSNCSPAEPGYFEQALRLNAEMSHGGVAIRDIDGEPHFVMVDTFPRNTVRADDIRRSVLEVAVHADQVEDILTGQDRH